MERYVIDGFRRRVDAGEVLTADDSQRLIVALDDARRAATTPSEYLVRVARSIDDLDRWTAEHPSLQMSTSASNPADALVLAGVELGRTLGEPVSDGRHRFNRVERAVADAVVRSTTDPSVADALAWALDELDSRTSELHDLRYRRDLADRSSHGDQQAHAELRAAALDRLTAAGVTVAANGFGSDGFDDADRLGLRLPCLVLAYRMRPSETNGDVSLPRFTSARSWFALSHRVEPRPMSRYETAVVTPLAINGDAELALRRFSPQVRSGTTVGALSAFRELAAVELPDIDVDRVTGPLSPAWVKLPLDALASMTRGTADEGLDVDTLVEADDDATWPFLPGAALIWIADDLDDDGW